MISLPVLLLLASSAAASIGVGVGGSGGGDGGGGGGGHCVWYGVCGEDPDEEAAHRKLNCKYDGRAKVASDEDAETLAEACPHLAEELSDPADGSVRLCCDSRQLGDLKRAFALPESLLGRCPACLANFRKNFCDLTCRPDQSKFVNVTKTVTGPTFKGMDGRMDCSSCQPVYVQYHLGTTPW